MTYPIIGSYYVQVESQNGEPQVSIYVLVDPRNGMPRYVGQTNCPDVRLRQHYWGYGGGAETTKWVRRLRAEGVAIRMDVIDQVPKSQANDTEKRWTLQLRSSGADLLNRNFWPANR